MRLEDFAKSQHAALPSPCNVGISKQQTATNHHKPHVIICLESRDVEILILASHAVECDDITFFAELVPLVTLTYYSGIPLICALPLADHMCSCLCLSGGKMAHEQR